MKNPPRDEFRRGSGSRDQEPVDPAHAVGPAPSEAVAQWLSEHLEAEPLREDLRAAMLRAARAGRLDRKLRLAAQSLAGQETNSLGEYVRQVRTGAQLDDDALAEHIGVPAAHLRELERSDQAVARFHPPSFAALLKAIELHLDRASAWVRLGLDPWMATGGLRSANLTGAESSPAVEAFLQETADQLRDAGRSDLVDLPGDHRRP